MKQKRWKFRCENCGRKYKTKWGDILVAFTCPKCGYETYVGQFWKEVPE